MAKIDRHDYAALYGPTTGDQVRLGDTALTAVVEKDHAVYGDECLHGGGKTLRDGIGMAGITSAEGALDFLLCNVVIIDPVIGIVKGDLGIRHGRVVGIGKAGNPAIMDGVDPRLIVSSGTTVRDCEGLIATPGAIDVHVHFDSAGLVEHALASGITSAEGALDFLLCNVLIIDPVIGIVKGDLGIRHGRVVGIGKAGNPAIMDGVDPRLIVSSGTTVRDCEGLIATPGAIDVHVHFDSAGLV